MITEARINQFINWLKDALYDIRCGNIGLGESLVQSTIEALEEALDDM